MKTYDLIVIGGGSGLDVAVRSAGDGKKVALIEKGPLGGTCLNRGCIPSKMLIHSADVMETIKNAEKFGLKVDGGVSVNFSSIVNRVSTVVDNDAQEIAKSVESDENIDWYKEEAYFTDTKVVAVGEEEITAEKILISAGTRPFIPTIEGLDSVEYMTSKEALRRTEQPKSMIVVGGGYIAAELAHFYGALGTEITIIELGEKMVSTEDDEISDLFTKLFSEKYKVVLGSKVLKVEKTDEGVRVFAEDKEGEKAKFEAEVLFLATGRRANSDILKLEDVGYELTEKGYPKSNDALETSIEGVYTLGDIAGKYFFKHSANLEAGYAYLNLWNKNQRNVDYKAMPHAIFSSPQVAGVGMTEQELKKNGIAYRVGRQLYKDTGMGQALQEEDGFVKVMLDDEGKILGCHIIGPEASTLIHEVVVAMRECDGLARNIRNTIHIHPALPEVVQRAFFKVR